MAIKLFSILNFVRKQMMKTDDDGIMRLPGELKAKYGEAVITKQLIDAGVDPRTIKNEQQLINILDSIDAMKTQRTTKPGTSSGIRNAESAKVFSIIDKKQIPNPEKNIMGGQAFETEEEIAERIAKQNKESVKKFKEKMKEDPEDMADARLINDMYRTAGPRSLDEDKMYLAEFIAEETGKVLDDLPASKQKIFIDRAEKALKKNVKKYQDPEDMADGGRIGLKKGMDRRTFMKIMGGLTTLPVLGKFFKGAEVAAPVAEKAAEVVSGAPPYFFNLVDRIRALGKRFDGPKERSESFIYKDYEMDIDYDTGAIDIKKTREAMIPGGDEAGVAEEVVMTYKPGMADETTKGRKVVDEYDEFTAKPDMDGKMKDVEEGVPDEVIREGSISKEELEQEIIEQLARDNKAGGGIAMMLGE